MLNWMTYMSRKVEIPQEERVVHSRYLHRAGACEKNCFQVS